MARKGSSRSAVTRSLRQDVDRQASSRKDRNRAPRGSGGGSGRAHRSAATGRYVTESTAKRHPDTTVTES
jgi:hypothetical protein